MSISDFEWKQENEWLENVLKEARKQLSEKRDFNKKLKKEAIDTQRARNGFCFHCK